MSTSLSPAEEERKSKKQRLLTSYLPAFIVDPHSLPAEILSDALLFLDVKDVPSASVTCKDWRGALKVVEDELWLGLVRRHCPSVEAVTLLLPAASADDANAADPSAETALAVASSAPSFGNDSGSDIPAPSRRWKSQFQRHFMLNRSDGNNAASAQQQRPPPKPLSSYFFQLDLILYYKEKGESGKGTKVGTVTRLFHDAKIENNRIVFDMNELGEEMSAFKFTEFDISITIYDKATGQQALLARGVLDDCWDHNYWYFDSAASITSAYVVDGLGGDDIISCTLFVMKNGCASECEHDWEFFTIPQHGGSSSKNSCGCCSCKSKWICFWDMTVNLRVAGFFDWDVVELEEAELLRVIDDHVVFK